MPLIIKSTGFEQYLDPSGGAYIKALIMGDHGVGKTPSAACWPKPIIADCEDGLMSVASMAIPYAEIVTSSDMKALYDHLRIECQKPPEKRKYLTFVLDTIDTYQRKLIQERLKAEKKDSLSGWADWGWLDGKMVQLIEQLLSLPMNIVVNMHTKDTEVDDGESKSLVQKARLKGDIKDTIFQDFDLIGHMEQSYEIATEGDQKGERVRTRQIRWHSEPRYPALRDRSNRLPRFTDVDFTGEDYSRLFNAIVGDHLDGMAEGQELETLETETDGVPAVDPVAGAPAAGGPLESPDLPRTPAKKAAAKKTAAKKAAPPKDEPKVEESAATPVETPKAEAPKAEEKPDPWAPEGQNGKGTADEPIILPDTISVVAESKAKEALEHVHSADGSCLKNAFSALCDAKNPGAGGVEDLTAPVAEDEPEPTDAEAEAAVAEGLGAEEVEVEEPPAEVAAAEPAKEEPKAEGAKVPRKCGDQPDSFVGKYDPYPGCGVTLDAKNGGQAQIAMVKFRSYLCNDDFAKAKSAAASN